jgi:hypothetical protein
MSPAEKDILLTQPANTNAIIQTELQIQAAAIVGCVINHQNSPTAFSVQIYKHGRSSFPLGQRQPYHTENRRSRPRNTLHNLQNIGKPQ